MMVGGTPQFVGGCVRNDQVSDLLHYRRRHESASSFLQSMEKRTQKTYRYGIGLVCIGATLNWIGFAQGSSYMDPLRYIGVASVISGSFCVCIALCRWLGRPMSMSGHLSSFEEDSLSSRSSGDVQVFNVAVPIFMSSNEFCRMKPPDYEIATEDPPPPNYDDAIKLTPETLPKYSPPSTSPSQSSSPNMVCLSKENETHVECPSPPPYHQAQSQSSDGNNNLRRNEVSSSVLSTSEIFVCNRPGLSGVFDENHNPTSASYLQANHNSERTATV